MVGYDLAFDDDIVVDYFLEVLLVVEKIFEGSEA